MSVKNKSGEEQSIRVVLRVWAMDKDIHALKSEMQRYNWHSDIESDPTLEDSVHISATIHVTLPSEDEIHLFRAIIHDMRLRWTESSGVIETYRS